MPYESGNELKLEEKQTSDPLTEIECKKCQTIDTVKSSLLSTWVCAFCTERAKNDVNFITICGLHPHNPRLGSNTPCPECYKIELQKRSMLITPLAMIERRRESDNSGLYSTMIKKQRKREDEARKIKQAQLDTPELLRTIISQNEAIIKKERKTPV